jgi:hypothetical protein
MPLIALVVSTDRRQPARCGPQRARTRLASTPADTTLSPIARFTADNVSVAFHNATGPDDWPGISAAGHAAMRAFASMEPPADSHSGLVVLTRCYFAVPAVAGRRHRDSASTCQRAGQSSVWAVLVPTGLPTGARAVTGGTIIPPTKWQSSDHAEDFSLRVIRCGYPRLVPMMRQLLGVDFRICVPCSLPRCAGCSAGPRPTPARPGAGPKWP